MKAMKIWIVPLLFAAAGAVISLFVYNDLPDRVAIHFGSSGEADNWLDRPFGAFLGPLLTIGLTALLYVRTKSERDEDRRLRGEASTGTVAAILSAVLLAVHILTLRHNLGHPMNVPVTACLIAGAVFVLVGNQAPRLGQKLLVWPRLPDAVHSRFARLQGRLMIGFGLAFLLLALLPSALVLPGFLVCLAAYVVVLFTFRFRFSKQA